MGIPFIDLKAQFRAIEPDVRRRIEAVLAHGQYIMGPEIKELEAELAGYVGVSQAVACASGTDALLWPLMAWGIGPGDAVLTTPFTFFATAEVIAFLGATPVFVDIDPQTFNIDPERLALALAALETRDPDLHPLPENFRELTAKAVIPVDLFGLPADYDRLLPLCAERGLKVVEDAAQSFGASLHGKRTGGFGDVGATSFFPAKPLGAYGDAGAVFTDDEALAKVLRSIRIHGMGDNQYDNVRLGVTGRMDTLQAAVLLAKLAVFPAELAARQAIAERYDAGLEGLLVTPRVPKGMASAWAQYSVLSEKRDAVRAALSKEGVPTAVYYPKALHQQPVFRHLGYRAGDFPVSEAASRSIFSLPMHPYLDQATQARIIETVARAVAE
jgi:dTDP-4-amino-4,6-dideoxygalactose transaminase